MLSRRNIAPHLLSDLENTVSPGTGGTQKTGACPCSAGARRETTVCLVSCRSAGARGVWAWIWGSRSDTGEASLAGQSPSSSQRPWAWSPQPLPFCRVLWPQPTTGAFIPAEEEPERDVWRRQRRGDLGEPAIHGRPRRLWAVHTQGVPRGHAHPRLVPLHPAQGGPEGGRGVLECLPLHPNQVGLSPHPELSGREGSLGVASLHFQEPPSSGNRQERGGSTPRYLSTCPRRPGRPGRREASEGHLRPFAIWEGSGDTKSC